MLFLTRGHQGDSLNALQYLPSYRVPRGGTTKGIERMQEQPPRMEQTSDQTWLLTEPYSISPGIQIKTLELHPPPFALPTTQHPPQPKQIRHTLQLLQSRMQRSYLQDLIGRTLAGGGLSDLQITTFGARVEISGLLSREGQRTPILVRGFLYESAGPYGGVVFYDIRAFGRPGLPAPALIPLLAARTGRNGPIKVKGCITLQFDIPSLMLRWGLAANGWKIPSYQHLQLKQIVEETNQLLFVYQPSSATTSLPFAQQDPAYPEWTALCMAEQRYIKTETCIGNGDYTTAIQQYAEASWQAPDDPFLQERLMQLYIASPQQEMWGKAYRIAETILQHNPQSSTALNCMAQYAEGLQDLQTAAHFYKQMGEVARRQNASNEASLAFSKAAELLERIDPTHAHELWQFAVSQNPNYRPAITALTRHALKSGQFTQAEQILLQLIEQTPPSIERARYNLSLAGLYRSRLRNLKSAREQLDLAAPYLNEDLPFLRELAEFRLATDENIDALRILDRLATRAKLLKQPVLYGDLLFRTGQILEERLGRPAQALLRYQEVIQTRPAHPYASSRIADLQAAGVQPELLPLGSFEDPVLLISEKEQALQTYQHIDTEQLRLHLELCRLYWQQQQIDQAIQAGFSALKLHPNHEVAWQLLEEICVRSGKHAELASIHQQMVAQAKTDEEALRHLEEALRLLPSERTITKQLSEYYDKLQEWDKLNVLYSRWLELAEPNEHAPLLLLQAQLREHRLQRLDQAEISYVQAYKVASENKTYLTAMIQYYIRHQSWEKLDLQLSQLSQELPPVEQAVLYAEKGKQLLTIPQHKKEALAAYQHALQCDPTNPEYLVPTIDLLRQEDHTSPLVPLLDQLAEVTEDPNEQLTYRKELAFLYDQELSQPDKAMEQYQHIVALEPSDKRALHRLAVLYQEGGQVNEAATIYSQLLKQLLDSDISEATLQLLQQMIVLFEQTGQNSEREKALEQLLQRQPDFGKQTPVPSVLSDLTSPAAAKALAMFSLGQAHQQPGLLLQAAHCIVDESTEAASFCLEAGLQLAPLHAELWLHRMKQTSKTKRPTLWKQLQTRIQKQPLTKEHNAQLSRLFAEIQNLDITAQEIKPVAEIFEQKELFIPSFFQLYARLLEQDGEMDAAIAIRQQLLLKLPEGAERNELHFELAVQRLHLLADREGGEQQLWELLVNAPGYIEAFYELQQLYDESGDLVGFVTALEENLGRAKPGSDRANLYLQTFELFQAISDGKEETLAFLQRNVQLSQDDPHTLQMLAVAYEEAEAYEEAVELYRTISKKEEPKDLVIQALEQSASLYMQALDQPDMALDFLLELMDKDPNNERAFAQLSEIYESLWMWNEMAELFNQKIERMEDPKQAASLLVDLGEIYLGRMEDYDMALQTYRRALRKAPKNLKVLRALLVLYEELQDWPAVVSALKATTRVEVNRKILCDTYMQIASISLDHLYRIEDTEEYYQLAHTQEPERMEPLEGLLALYEATDNPERMIETAVLMAIISAKQDKEEACQKGLQRMLDGLQRAPSITITPEAQVRAILQERQESAALAQKLIDVLRELTDIDLNDSAQLQLHRTLSQLHQQHIQELAWLLRLWHSSEESSIPLHLMQEIIQNIEDQSWSGVVQKLVPLQKDAESEDASSYQLSIAEIALYALEQPRQAKAFADKALAGGAPPERALLIFESIQWKEQGHLSLAPLLAKAKELPHPEDRSRAIYHLAGALLLRDGQWGDALQCLIEASAETPQGEGLLPLREPLTTMHQALDLEGTTPEQLQDMLPAELEASHKALLQAWISFQFSELEPGIQYLQEALKADPDNTPALRLLGHFFFEEGQSEQALSLLYHFIEREWDFLPFDEVVEACTSLAYLYNHQQNWDNAIFYLEQATQFVSEDPRILQYHSEALAGAERWDELQALYQSHLDNPEPTDVLEDLWFKMGQIHEQQRENHKEALECYQHALTINPEHQPSLRAAQFLSQQDGLQ